MSRRFPKKNENDSKPTGENQIFSQSAIEHILINRPERMRALYLKPEASGPRIDNLIQLAKRAKVPIQQNYDFPWQEEVSALIAPFVFTPFKEFLEEASSTQKAVVLALDHIQDPQNLGAICRTAEGLGVQAVLIPKDRSATIGPGVYHASVGAIETLKLITVPNLSESLRRLKELNYWVVGTAVSEKAKPPEETPTFEKIILVLGSEWEGMSSGLEKCCDWLVNIPLRGKVESLNVNAAGALLTYYFIQRILR
jgi:23S rRNA (guanosine2251-2'-O)-methyltransferase